MSKEAAGIVATTIALRPYLVKAENAGFPTLKLGSEIQNLTIR
jgi:hypothetical protein